MIPDNVMRRRATPTHIVFNPLRHSSVLQSLSLFLNCKTLFKLRRLPRITTLLLLSSHGWSLRYETFLLICLGCIFLVYHLRQLDWAWAFGHPWGWSLSGHAFFFLHKIHKIQKPLMYIHFYDFLLVRTSLGSIWNSRTWSVRGQSGLLAVAYVRVSSK